MLMQYLTAFGLASGAGTKATIPMLALGLFHYTPWFELSGRWDWIASPPVLATLLIMLIAELWIDSHPELGEWASWAAYLPTMVSGFIAFAAATGTVDRSLLQLAGSGLLGGATSVAVLAGRNRIRGHSRRHIETIHDSMPMIASAGEAGIATTISAAAILAPVLSVFVVGVGLASLGLLSRVLDAPRNLCAGCGGLIRVGALVCPSCSLEQPQAG